VLLFNGSSTLSTNWNRHLSSHFLLSFQRLCSAHLSQYPLFHTARSCSVPPVQRSTRIGPASSPTPPSLSNPNPSSRPTLAPPASIHTLSLRTSIRPTARLHSDSLILLRPLPIRPTASNGLSRLRSPLVPQFTPPSARF
jgi:hypothetical protein